jgi:hypothetical protein
VPDAGRSALKTAVTWAFLALAALCVIAVAIWGGLALRYQFPGGTVISSAAGVAWVALSLTALVFLLTRKRRLRTIGIYALLFAGLLIWWNTIRPSNDRNWADDVAEMVTGEIQGDQVTLQNVRNFHWRDLSDYTPAWETRTYDLRNLNSVDLLLSYWSGPAIAHTLVSFGFSDGQFVTFSVEIRKERHEAFSEIGGFFKQFETSVVAAEERDIVLLRTNIRKEDVHLYRINMPAPVIRSLFIAYVQKANELAAEPRFYHTITANCTTIVYQMVARIVDGLPIDYRLLFSGYLPDYIETVGGFAPGFTLPQLKEAGAISKRGQDAGDTPDFSKAIRAGVPGIDQ